MRIAIKSRVRVAVESLLKRIQDAEEEATPVISHSRAAVLGAVLQAGRRGGVGGIAEVLSVSQPYATQTVRELEDAGLVHRVVRLGSKRHSIVLTKEGATVLAAYEGYESSVIDRALSDLALNERALLCLLIDKACSEGG